MSIDVFEEVKTPDQILIRYGEEIISLPRDYVPTPSQKRWLDGLPYTSVDTFLDPVVIAGWNVYQCLSGKPPSVRKIEAKIPRLVSWVQFKNRCFLTKWGFI